MIKPQNKNIILSIFQFIFLLGIFLIQYFSRKKMGVQRTLVYYNYNLENNYNIKIIIILISLGLLIYLIYNFYKYKTLRVINLLSTIAILILMTININKFKLIKYAISFLLLLINILEFNKIGEKYEKHK